jgi:hypothetical protein
MLGNFHKWRQERNTFPVAGSFLAVQPTPLSGIVLAFNPDVGLLAIRSQDAGHPN